MSQFHLCHLPANEYICEFYWRLFFSFEDYDQQFWVFSLPQTFCYSRIDSFNGHVWMSMEILAYYAYYINQCWFFFHLIWKFEPFLSSFLFHSSREFALSSLIGFRLENGQIINTHTQISKFYIIFLLSFQCMMVWVFVQPQHIWKILPSVLSSKPKVCICKETEKHA